MLIALLRQHPDPKGIRRLLEVLTESRDGRVETTFTLAGRLRERIADVRAQLEEFSILIENQDARETDAQQFLERYPWIVGLHYVRARGRVEVPRGTVDFVLERFDGFFDIVELKGPREEIIIDREASDEATRPSAPSRFSLSRGLSNALAQAHMYRSILGQSGNLRGQFGLPDIKQPRILILIGQAKRLPNGADQVLSELNLSLHRVEIVPYDHLKTRVSGLLDNLEKLIANPLTSIPPA